MNPRWQLLISGLLLLLSFAWFELTPTDLWLQALLYDTQRQAWVWSNKEPVTRFLLYDGAKGLLILFALGLLISLAFCRRWSSLASRCRGIRILLLSLILVPLTVAGLKTATNVACPRSLELFGGALPYIKVLEAYPAGTRPKSIQRCFPASHASGGFALMALIWLFRDPRRRRLAVAAGVLIGWITGGYKMAIGDHFFSHTLISMLLAWFIINLIVIVDRRIFPNPGGGQRLKR